MTENKRLLELALKGLEVERQHLAEEITNIQRQLGAGTPRPQTATAAVKPRKNRLTAAGRRKLSELMTKRWAERRKAAARTAKGSK